MFAYNVLLFIQYFSKQADGNTDELIVVCHLEI